MKESQGLLVNHYCEFRAYEVPDAVGPSRLTSAAHTAQGKGRTCWGGHGEDMLGDGSMGIVRLLTLFHACLNISIGSKVEIYYYHIDGEIKAGLEITNKCIFQFESNRGPLFSPARGREEEGWLQGSAGGQRVGANPERCLVMGTSLPSHGNSGSPEPGQP